METYHQQSFVVTAARTGERVDRVLVDLCAGRSRASLQRAIAAGAITVNGRRPRNRDRVKAGDCIHITWPPTADDRDEITADATLRLSILYEDEDLLVINKPAGLTVHPGAGKTQSTLVHALLAYSPQCFAPMLDADRRPGIVHRLDKDTSGVLAIAKNPATTHSLKKRFQNRDIEKTYLALVAGIPQAAQGSIDLPIGRHPVQRQKMAIAPTGRGRAARTAYDVLSTGANAALLQVRIATGRTHQIRVHLTALGHSVVGDRVYGRRQSPHRVSAPRQMLHAWTLAFAHPTTGRSCRCIAPLPEDFIQSCQSLGIAPPALA